MKPWNLTAAVAAVALASVPASVGASAAEDRPIRLTVHAETLHPVSPLLFGQFMEDAKHADGRGEWGPQSPDALNDDGSLRPSVRQRLAELHAPIVRFPGGFMIENANEQYDYRIWLPGPVEGLWLDADRPLKLERRRYGLLQFYATCDRLDAQPLIVVPTKPVFQGQWSVQQAAEFAAGLVAFSNADTPSDVPAGYRGWVEARLRAGRAAPAGVTYWQIGNEVWLYKRNMQRRWRQEAEERGVAPAEVNPLTDDAAWFDLQLELINTMSRAMRDVDPDIQIITDGMTGGDFNRRMAALRPGVDMFSDHRYMPWGTGKSVELDRDGVTESVPVEQLTAEEHFRALVSTPGFDAAGRSHWAYRHENDRHDKPMALTEWNWNGWGDAVRGHPHVRPGWAQAVGAAGFLHAIMRRGDRAVIACQSMMLGSKWNIAAVRVGDHGEPFLHPTGRVTGFYSRHHGPEMLALDDADVPRYEQPYRMNWTPPAERVALIDALATADPDRVYVHLIHRSFALPHAVSVDLSAVASDDAGHAELRLLLGRTDLDLGDPDHAGALPEITKTVELDGGVADFELPAQAVAVLIVNRRPHRFVDQTAADVD